MVIIIFQHEINTAMILKFMIKLIILDIFKISFVG